jgi:glycerol-3-phosphate acyltransferase PlsY
MDAVLAVVTLLGTVTLAVMAVWLLTRLIKTIVELRKITTGMHVVLGWTIGQVLADPVAHPSRVDGTSAGARKLESG